MPETTQTPDEVKMSSQKELSVPIRIRLQQKDATCAVFVSTWNDGVLALDLSLTSTGLCYRNTRGDIVTGTIEPNVKDLPRLEWMKSQMTPFIKKCSMVVIEGYSMGSRGRVFSIGELGGIIKLLAFSESKPILLVPPKTLKVFVTGNGNADKDMVKQSIEERWSYLISQDDEADAFGLLMLSDAYFSRKRRQLDEKRKQALSKCEYIKAGN